MGFDRQNEEVAFPPKMTYENKGVLSGFIAFKPYKGSTPKNQTYSRVIVGQVREINRSSHYYEGRDKFFIDYFSFVAFGDVGERLSKLEQGRGYRFYYCATLVPNENKSFSEKGAIKGFHNSFRLVPPYFEPVPHADPISKQEAELYRKEREAENGNEGA